MFYYFVCNVYEDFLYISLFVYYNKCLEIMLINVIGCY